MSSWQWPFLALLWLSIPIFLVMLIALPETFAPKIVHDKMQKKRSRDTNLGEKPTKSWSKVTSTLNSALLQPTRIMIIHPGVFFANIYTCIIYAIYYTCFTSFPLVYQNIYGFNPRDLGLAFLAITVGTIMGNLAFLPWACWWARSAKTLSAYEKPERCLVPALYACLVLPAGLLIFGT